MFKFRTMTVGRLAPCCPTLLERVFDIDLQRCPRCGGGQVKIIAAILERAVIGKILTHLGLQPQPPPHSKAREVGHEDAA